jgi:hypothetical protein
MLAFLFPSFMSSLFKFLVGFVRGVVHDQNSPSYPRRLILLLDHSSYHEEVTFDFLPSPLFG